MQTKTLTAETLIIPFGKYKGMRVVDIAEIYIVDKNGEDKPAGLLYLQWLCTQEWYTYKDIIHEIIDKADLCNADKEEQEIIEEIKKPKKKKEGCVKINTESKVVDFQ